MLFLKFVRLTRDISQKVIAKQCNMPKAYLSWIEGGLRNPTPSESAALEQAFNYPIERLLTHVNEQSLVPGLEARDEKAGQ